MKVNRCKVSVDSSGEYAEVCMIPLDINMWKCTQLSLAVGIPCVLKSKKVKLSHISKFKNDVFVKELCLVRWMLCISQSYVVM